MPQIRFPFGMDLGSLGVSSNINIGSLPEEPVPGLNRKLMTMGTKFQQQKLSIPDVIVYDHNTKVRLVIEVCTVVLYILLCILIHYFGCNIFLQDQDASGRAGRSKKPIKNGGFGELEGWCGGDGGGYLYGWPGK